jgi:hypothetical protein
VAGLLGVLGRNRGAAVLMTGLAVFMAGGACAPSHKVPSAKPASVTETATSPSPAATSAEFTPSSPSKPLPTPSTPQPATASSCSASMSNPTPGDGGSETLSVTGNVPSAPVRLVVHYKTKNTSYSGATDASGAASVPFGIGRPTIGYTVTVDVTVGQQASCSTAFTPQ